MDEDGTSHDDVTEAYLRAIVGFIRATNSLVFASPHILLDFLVCFKP